MFKIQDDAYLKRTLKLLFTTLLIFLINLILAIIFSPSIETLKSDTDGTHNSVDRAQGLQKVWEYILNNGFKVPFQMLILTIIPIPFLYYLNIIKTTVPLGIAFGFVLHLDLYKGIMMIIASTPHSIVEILGFWLIASSLFKFKQFFISKINTLL